MTDVKWVKLSTEMFDNKKIRYLRGLPEGNNIVLIWVMLLTMAGRCNANGYIFLTENIPYSPLMLANELGFPENTIHVALVALESLGMISRNEEELLIPGWEEHQNTLALEQIRESNRKRQEKYREKAKQLEDKDVQTLPTREEKTEQKEKPEEILFERLWGLYPNKKGKGQVSTKAKKKLLEIGYEELSRAVERYKEELKKDEWRKAQYGSTFFNSGYVDYLDANFVPSEKSSGKPQKENKFNNFEQRKYDFADLERGLIGQ